MNRSTAELRVPAAPASTTQPTPLDGLRIAPGTLPGAVPQPRPGEELLVSFDLKPAARYLDQAVTPVDSHSQLGISAWPDFRQGKYYSWRVVPLVRGDETGGASVTESGKAADAVRLIMGLPRYELLDGRCRGVGHGDQVRIVSGDLDCSLTIRRASDLFAAVGVTVSRRQLGDRLDIYFKPAECANRMSPEEEL